MKTAVLITLFYVLTVIVNKTIIKIFNQSGNSKEINAEWETAMSFLGPITWISAFIGIFVAVMYLIIEHVSDWMCCTVQRILTKIKR